MSVKVLELRPNRKREENTRKGTEPDSE